MLYGGRYSEYADTYVPPLPVLVRSPFRVSAMQFDLPAAYQQAWRVINTDAPGPELEALLQVLNPDHLRPTELQVERPDRWAEPWLLSSLSSAACPTLGWSDRVVWDLASNGLRAGLLSLGLATAAWRGDLKWGPSEPEGLLARIGDSLASARRLLRCGLRWLWAEFDDDMRSKLTSPPADGAVVEGMPVGDGLWAHVRRLWGGFRRVDPNWRMRYELIDDMGTFGDPPILAIPGQPLTVISLPGGGVFVVWREDCVPSDLGVPSVCPNAALFPPVLLAPGIDLLAWLEDQYRTAGLLSERQSVHWVGSTFCVSRRCECSLLHPEGGPAFDGDLVLYREATELLRTVRLSAGRRLASQEWEAVERLAQGSAIRAVQARLPCSPGSLGSPPADVSWHGPAAIPIRATQNDSPPTIAHSPAWESCWETIRGSAARAVMDSVRPRLVVGQGEAEPLRCSSPELTLPASVPVDLRAAFDLLCWAAEWANRVVRLCPPESHFETTRRNLLARIECGETEWLSFAERDHVWPAVRGEEDDFEWVNDQVNVPEPIIDVAAQQLVHLLWAWCEAVGAYRTVECEFAAVPGGGFAIAFAALARILESCFAALGLSAKPTDHQSCTELKLPGITVYAVPPRLPSDLLKDTCHRLAPIPAVVLDDARAQVLAATHRRSVDEKTSTLVTQLARQGRGGRVRGKPKTTDAVDALMMRMFRDNQEECLAYSAEEWAKKLKCSKSTVQETATWEAIRDLRAAQRPMGGGKRRGGKPMSNWGEED